jgi:hypothetical protein
LTENLTLTPSFGPQLNDQFDTKGLENIADEERDDTVVTSSDVYLD